MKKSETKNIDIIRAKKHIEKLENEIKFLQRALVKSMPLKKRMKIIDDEYGRESAHVQCEALKVNRGTYLNHRYRNKNDDTWYKRREAEFTELIRQIYTESGHVYGAKKITAILKKRGKMVSCEYVVRIMRKLGIRSVRNTGNKDYIIISNHIRQAAHSSQEFKVTGINQVWVSDTSAVLIKRNYYYVCVYIDLYSRKVVGCRVGRNNSTQLVKSTFTEAFKNRGKPKNLIVHTDNGSCYVSYSLNLEFNRLGVGHSFSRPHCPRDNAVAESFFNTLKREAIYLHGYPKSLRELKEHVSEYIKRYNSERPHEHLKYLSPDEYEKGNGDPHSSITLH